jgi:hypothetical protein
VATLKLNGSSSSLVVRDADWRTYEILQTHPDHPELAKVGQIFRAWPWGDSVYMTENFPKLTLNLASIEEWIDKGLVKLIAPKRLVKSA